MSKYKLKNVAILTTSRADYSILRNLINLCKSSKKLKFKLIVSGQHMSKKYGNTFKEIESDYGKKNLIKINLNVSLSNVEFLIQVIQNAGKKFSNLFTKNKFDFIILLGDRYETLSIAITSVMHEIPIIHINGGEKTIGSTDDMFRHCITKLSNYHFVSCKRYFKRVLQLGEKRNNIFNVGSLGVEAFSNSKTINKTEIERKLKIKFSKKNYLICVNSTTYGNENINNLLKNLFLALNEIKDSTIIFTLPNSDLKSDIISRKIKDFCKSSKNAFYFKNLGHIYFKSVLKNCNAIIGNSSSGVIEVPSLGIPTINIGIRQEGRERTTSIIDCKGEREKILNAIYKSQNTKFKFKYITKRSKKFLYKKNSSKKIFKKILALLRTNIQPKEFVDIIK